MPNADVVDSGRIGVEDGMFCIGDRRFPYAEFVTETLEYGEGHIFRIRRARLKFESGWELSIIWGSATHSDNYRDFISGAPFHETPRRVEVGICKPNDEGLAGEPLRYIDAPHLLTLIEGMNSGPDGLPVERDNGEN